MKQKIASLFPYVGGKTKLAEVLCQTIMETLDAHPEITTFSEICGGGGRVILNLPRRGRQIYSDFNPCFGYLFWAVSDRERVAELIHALEQIPVTREKYEELYIVYKEWANHIKPIEDPIKCAAYTYFLTHMAFNGRVGIPGFYSKQEGMRVRDEQEDLKNIEGYWRSFERLSEFPDILQGVEFWYGDCRRYLLECNSPKYLHYIDPPYLKNNYLPKVILDKMEKQKGDDFTYHNIVDRIPDEKIKDINNGEEVFKNSYDIGLRGDYTSGITLRLHMDIVNLAKESKSRIILSGYTNGVYDYLLEHPNWRRIKLSEQAVVSSSKKIKDLETEYIWLNF